MEEIKVERICMETKSDMEKLLVLLGELSESFKSIADSMATSAQIERCKHTDNNGDCFFC